MKTHETSVTCERALELILDGARPLDGEQVALDEADGRAAGREVRARRRLPAWDNSAKDGYAVALADLEESAVRGDTSLQGHRRSPAHLDAISLPVVGEVAAGRPPGTRLEPGTAVRIMTGAPLPEGADAVVQVEDTVTAAGTGRFAATGERVTLLRRPARGENVRPAGQDVEVGDVVVEEGEELTPARVALLAALGEAQIEVCRRPRVTVIPTGDEVVEVGREAPPGAVYSSTAHALAAYVRRAGGVPRVAEIVPDDRLLVHAAVFEALETSEVLVTTGGVSAGEHDHVRDVIAEAAGGLVFWRVRMRPGDPLVFARTSDLAGIGRVPTRHLFGLPGNPTSAVVTFLEFARPLLRRVAGFSDIFLPTLRVVLGTPLRVEPGRRSFVRVRLEAAGDELVAVPAGEQGSGLLRPLAEADALLIAGPERTELAAGERAVAQLLRSPRSRAAFEV